MSNRKRLIFEVVVALLLILICVAIWNTTTWRTAATTRFGSPSPRATTFRRSRLMPNSNDSSSRLAERFQYGGDVRRCGRLAM